MGHGGQNKLSDEEKKRRGTFRADRSEETYAAQAGAKVVQGPWLSEIPEPDFPLRPEGRAKYNEWTKELFEQNKLTLITVTQASALALLHQQIVKRSSEGKDIAASVFAKFQSGMRDLNSAQNAKVTAGPTRSRFADSGFSNRRLSPFRLRPSSSADS